MPPPPPLEILSTARRYMWVPTTLASRISAPGASVPLLPKLPTADPLASNFVIVDVPVVQSEFHTYKAPVESDRMNRPDTATAPLVPKLVSMAPADVSLTTEFVKEHGPWPHCPVSTLAYVEPEGPTAISVTLWNEPEGGAGKDTVPPLPHEVSGAPADVSRTRTGAELLFRNTDPPRMNDPSEPWMSRSKRPVTCT